MNSKFTLAARLSGFLRVLIFSILLSLASTITSNGQTALPRPDHIVILIEENEPNSWVVGSSSTLGNPQVYAPTINELAADTSSAVFMNMTALTHPSEPNYLYLFAGDNQGVTTDDPPTNYPFTTPNMAAQLIAAGLSFKTYSEDLPNVGSDVVTSSVGSYARKHNPVANWVGTGTNQVSDTLNQPYTDFPTDYSQLPTVCYVVPDEDSDMHNGSGLPPIESGDDWFCEHLECHTNTSFMDWVRTHNTLFILTFDEDNGDYNNNIPTIFFGPMVKGGSYSQSVTLCSILKMVEDMYSLTDVSCAANAAPINFCWLSPDSATTGVHNLQANNAHLSVYPNPTSSIITVDASKWSGQTSEISITDLSGKNLAHFKLPASGKLDIDISTFATGTYFYHLDQANTILESGKFNVSR